MGTLIVITSWIFTSSCASAIMPSASSERTSALMDAILLGEASAISVISFTTDLNSLPSFAIRLGFVVTPDRTPQDAASRISSVFAVSMNIFMFCLLFRVQYFAENHYIKKPAAYPQNNDLINNCL